MVGDGVGGVNSKQSEQFMMRAPLALSREDDRSFHALFSLAARPALLPAAPSTGTKLGIIYNKARSIHQQDHLRNVFRLQV